ncbi:MAG TPA: hypothetical protein VKQ52_04475 [Puia sp.]|nr:hypothetical protein [Puia sp.]
MKRKRVQKKLGIPMTEEEHQAFMKGYKATVYRSISAYARKLLLGKPVQLIYRDRSLDDFIETAVKLRKELKLLLAKDSFTPSEKERLQQDITSIEENLIKLVETCCQK